MSPALSPKVSRSVFAGIVVSAILANITAVDPAMLAWFGPWSPFIYGTAVALLSGVAGYLTRDPLRDLGQEHLNAGTPLPGTQVPAAVTAALPVTPATTPAPGPRHLAS